jgi:hypothetical protein
MDTCSANGQIQTTTLNYETPIKWEMKPRMNPQKTSCLLIGPEYVSKPKTLQAMMMMMMIMTMMMKKNNHLQLPKVSSLLSTYCIMFQSFTCKEHLLYYIQVKVKFTLEQAMRSRGGVEV